MQDFGNATIKLRVKLGKGLTGINLVTGPR